ncbi:MAG: RidA family protein [Rhizobiales bacterium]|nr:RidA family protein [Hyphomicrobiales bacterium]
MNEQINPKTVHKPLGKYSHTVRVPANAEWLAIAGQVGMNAKGEIASGVRRQTERALRNILACLRANGMTKEHLVKLTIYLTDARHVEEMRAARSKVLGDDVQPASTLVIVDGLASPEFLVEVEAWAARA